MCPRGFYPERNILCHYFDLLFDDINQFMLL